MKKTMLIITVLLILIMSASCAAANDKAKEGWPDDIPSSLPEFTYGVYQSDQTTRSVLNQGSLISYQLQFTGVSREDLDAYAEELRKTSLNVIPIEGEGEYIIRNEQLIDGLCLVPLTAYLKEPAGACTISIEIHFDHNINY